MLSRLLLRWSSSSSSKLSIPSSPGRVSFIGAPFSGGQPLAGAELGPSALRASSLPRAAAALGWTWHDCGDVPAARAGAAGASAGAVCADVARATEDAARAGDFVLLAGGDHSVAAGSVAGALAARPDAGVVWVDAHADINTPSESPSGNLHGMPLALLLGRVRAGELGADWEWLLRRGAAPLSPKALVYVGLRDLDPGEVAAIRSLGILSFTMADVDRLGIARVMEAVLAALAGRPLHLSFDVDGVDPTTISATGTAVPGGLSYRESHFLCEALAASRRLVSVDIVEINPLLGGAAEARPTTDMRFTSAGVATTAAAAAFVTSALGKTTL